MPVLKLRQLLIVDAVTCLVTGIALVALTGVLAGLLGLPPTLLFWAGIILFPCAALMSLAARNLAGALVWLVIAGNGAWAVASVVVAFALEPTGLGFAFVLAQALLVAALGFLEWRARKASRTGLN